MLCASARKKFYRFLQNSVLQEKEKNAKIVVLNCIKLRNLFHKNEFLPKIFLKIPIKFLYPCYYTRAYHYNYAYARAYIIATTAINYLKSPILLLTGGKYYE